MQNEFGSLLIDLWRDLQQPDALWQAGALALCLGLGWLADRLVRGRAVSAAAEGIKAQAWRLGERGLRRLVFPLAALLFVLVARVILGQWQHVNLLSVAVPLLVSLAVIRVVFFVLRHSFPHAGWLAAFERSFALFAWGIVALHITGLLPQLIDLLEGVGFTVGKQKLNLWMIQQGIGAVLVTLLVALWISGLIEARLMAAQGMDSNLRAVLTRLSKAVLIVLAVLIGLPAVGIDLTMLSVFGGAIGVGLGFGLQKIAASYISGFIILLDRSLSIGDLISVGSERGQVTQITTRYTVLKGLTGVEVIVPNEVLVSSVVLNESYTDPKMRISLPVQVSYAADLERAMAILVAAALAQPRVLRDPLPVALVAAFADSGINLELGFWIADPANGTGPVRSDINLAIWQAFKAEGIEIPFPQREVRIVGGTVSV
ncbi:MAG: mechanosensitive ion channel protein MscS [Rhodocyclales bacterium GWA2_65_20]|nr:MAG: mechanosensitive ion channel protein MscS [Rhodocyclales bacterium GWA2_65_20]